MELEKIKWERFSMKEMPSTQLYKMLQLRSEVFVVEQNCIYQDMDDVDLIATHLIGNYNATIVACTRLIAPEFYNGYSSIGRVCTKQSFRALSIGKELMNRSIQTCIDEFPTAKIKISAQQYLNKFYTDLGFYTVGEGYLEDDIPHIAMVYERHLASIINN